MPGVADDIEQERPAIELAVDSSFGADRWYDVINHVLGNVVVPGLDHVRLDHCGHFNERRLAYIDVPGRFLVFCFRNKALDTEAFDRGDLVVYAWKPLVDLGNAGMEILNPLIECWC